MKSNEPGLVGMPVIVPSALNVSPAGSEVPERVHVTPEGFDSSVAEYSLPLSAGGSVDVIMLTESPGLTVRVSTRSDETELLTNARTLNAVVPACVGVPARSPDSFNTSP